MTTSKEDNVRVVVRCRPLLDDLEKDEEIVVKINNDEQTIQLINNRQFTFDRIFDSKSTNDDVYNNSAKHIVDCVLQGYNGTIFAYGQTGTGKTYTSSGIMENSFKHIFDHISCSKQNQKFLVRASYYEIYNEEIYDLLNQHHHHKNRKTNKDKQKILELKEDTNGQIIIKNLSNFIVNNINELLLLKENGDKQRKFSATKMNHNSSRSHTIFTLTIEMKIDLSNSDDQDDDKILSRIRIGKFHLIDLAGSERQTKTGTTGLRLKEAAKINQSLTSLSLVIAALTDPKSTFIPYRNSKLTRILSDSLGGNSKTLLIACIGPAKSNLDETISTLRFASQTKFIKNKPIINEDNKDTLLKCFEQQVKELRKQLQEQDDDEETTTKNDEIKKIIPNELLEKLRKLEEKICIGGENLLEKAEKQEKLLANSERELMEHRQNEYKLRQELEAKQRKFIEIEESYLTLNEEQQALNRKIRKAYGYLKESRSELDDMQVEHEKLRGELLDSIRISEKELKLTNLLIHNYIPDNYLKFIETNVNYNQHIDEWQLNCLAFTGNNMRNNNIGNNNDFDFENDHFDNDFNNQNLNSNNDNIYLSYSNLNIS